MWILNAVITIVSGILILRIAGRKSISQMSISQTVLMISIGSLIVRPLGNNSILKTLLIALIFVFTLVIIEFLQLRFRLLELFINGKSIVLIENGKLIKENLKKTRLTVAKLEMRLRQYGVQSIDDLKTATIEINGEIGFELKEEKKPITEELLRKLLIEAGFSVNPPQYKYEKNIFEEVKEDDEELNKKSKN